MPSKYQALFLAQNKTKKKKKDNSSKLSACGVYSLVMATGIKQINNLKYLLINGVDALKERARFLELLILGRMAKDVFSLELTGS